MFDPIYTLDARRIALVEALRSGDYEQGKGYLKKDGGFCCLGVACDVYHKETGKGEWTPESENLAYSMFLVNKQFDAFSLPNEVQEWFGFSSSAGGFGARNIPGLETNALIRENDDGRTFAEIADLIESNPEGMFV